MGKLIQKAREKKPTGKMGPKLTAPSIYKMRVGKARGKAPSPKPVAIKTIEPNVPYVPFEPKWKEPKIDIIRAPEPAVPITQPTKPIAPTTKLLAPPAQPKLLTAPPSATQPASVVPTTTTTPTTKPVELPKTAVITPPPETLPDTTPQVTKDYNDVSHYFDLNTTKQYEIERRTRDETIAEKNKLQTTNPEMAVKLSKYIETRNKRLEEWRKKLKNEIISLVEGLPVNKMIMFSSANRRTNVFIRKAMKLGTMHYGIIDIGSETRWVDRLKFYGETSPSQKDLSRREPAPMRYYVPPEERKSTQQKAYEIDKLIARMIGITEKPSLGVSVLDKALVKYKFLDKSIFGFKDEEPFARTWDPSKGGRPLEELREVIRERIAEKLLFEYISKE